MYPKYKRHSGRAVKAFTIVELLIVIVVIAILATVGVASYIGVQRKAEVVSMKNDLRLLSDEMQFFYKDNDRYPIVYPQSAAPLTELEAVLRATDLYEATREPEPKKKFIFCAPTEYDPQRYAIVGREFLSSDVADVSKTVLHYVTSNDPPSSTPMLWDDAIATANPDGPYAANVCNTISVKTGVSYFGTRVQRWSYDIPLNN